MSEFLFPVCVRHKRLKFSAIMNFPAAQLLYSPGSAVIDDFAVSQIQCTDRCHILIAQGVIPYVLIILLQQLEHFVRNLVCLSKHGLARLL